MNYKKFSKTYSYSRTFRYWRIADNKLSSHRCVGGDTPFLTTVICNNCKIFAEKSKVEEKGVLVS